MSNNLKESIMTTIMLATITFFSQLILSYLFGEDPLISIGKSTQINDNTSILTVDIQTYDQVLEDLEIVIDSKISENQIKASRPIDMKIIQGDISAPQATTLIIKKISTEQLINLYILSDNKINTDDIKVYSNSNKVEIMYDAITKNPLKERVKFAILSALIYAIIIGFATYRINSRRELNEANRKKHFDQEIEKLKGELLGAIKENEKLEKDIETSRIAIKNVKKDLQDYETNSLKKQILLQAKLNDFKKELRFWRDTIRKTLYNKDEGFSKSEKLFEIVTKSLKTYQTNEKNNYDFESLKVLSKMINDIDNDKKD